MKNPNTNKKAISALRKRLAQWQVDHQSARTKLLLATDKSTALKALGAKQQASFEYHRTAAALRIFGVVVEGVL